MITNKQYTTWHSKLSEIKFPQWKELPTLGLYIDQVVTIVNDQLQGLGVEPLTKSMVNNYVKKKFIQAPVKKQYAVNQLVDLLLISFFKTSFSIDQIRAGIAQVTVGAYPQQSYDRFVEIINAKLAGDAIESKSEDDELVGLAVEAVLAKLKVTNLVKGMDKNATTVK
ncbi:MAG: DUF1836 domain-containing protein [Limosilactobacillus sp.]|uniref:DUF1836 domain-containing protein n=1 Tax=Limosilactobacillus sp. TaxID=2773925 RepID=UPI0026F629A4|nr:DUF1836 domain-containing protein [Limosilactobacillus sp.]